LQGPESVADDMYRMGVMALIAADLPAGVNRDRCVEPAPSLLISCGGISSF
jgi:putative hydrolase of HD superfamily